MLRKSGGKRVSAAWAYTIQACFISWAAWLPALLLAGRAGYVPLTGALLLSGGVTPVDNVHVVVLVLFLLGSYGPLLSGLGISARLGGAQGVRTLWGRMGHWRLQWRWYAFALVLPVGIMLPAIVVALVTGGAAGSLGARPGLIPLVLLFFLVTLATGEFGWRGTALALAQRRTTAEQSSYLVASMWILWMLPYLLALYIGTSVGATLPLHLIGWGIYLVGASVILTWLYNNTASLWLCMLYIAMAFTLWTVATTFLSWPSLSQMVLGLASWLVALLLLRRYGPLTLKGTDEGDVARARRR